MNKLVLIFITLLSALALPSLARADILADFLGWILKEPESITPATEFQHSDCPFTFKGPEGAKLDADGIDVTKWQDGSRQVSATWHRDDLEIAMFCTPNADYQIPAGFVERICRPNPLLVEGSFCGPSTRFDGVEVYYPQQLPDAEAKYFWLYTGHKVNGGRIRIRIAYTGAAPLPETGHERTSDVSRNLISTIK